MERKGMFHLLGNGFKRRGEGQGRCRAGKCCDRLVLSDVQRIGLVHDHQRRIRWNRNLIRRVGSHRRRSKCRIISHRNSRSCCACRGIGSCDRCHTVDRICCWGQASQGSSAVVRPRGRGCSGRRWDNVGGISVNTRYVDNVRVCHLNNSLKSEDHRHSDAFTC
jgi:hypothetical protein